MFRISKINQFLKRNLRSAKLYVSAYLRSGHTLHVRIIGGVFIAAFALFFIGYYGLIQPPHNFPVGTLVSVPKGATAAEVAEKLEDERVIRSADTFLILARLPNVGGDVLFGEYFFEVPQNVFEVVSRITEGTFGLNQVRVTIPEGATVAEIGALLDKKMPSFPLNTFMKLAKEKEGYLFPDTYFFLPNAKPEHIIEAMEDNFKKKITTIEEDIGGGKRTLEEIIIMASIIEKETIEYKDMKLVSGILWKRIEIGMPLQVDAPFVYSIGKNSFQLSIDDLEADSPYNTYTNRGLPPTPIANPGLKAIEAAANPKDSPYLFFLSDLHNNMHYAEDFEEHKRNKRLYLN